MSNAKRGLIALVCVLWAASAQAQVAFDAGSEHQNNNDGSCSWSHTTAGSNRVLYLAIVYIDALTSMTASYNAVDMGAPFIDTRATNRRLVVWRMVAPATGANTATITWTDGNREPLCAGASFTGVDQVTPNDANVESDGLGTSSTHDVASAVGEMVMSWAVNAGVITAWTAGAGQTEIQQEVSALAGANLMTSYESGAATVTMSTSWTSSATWRQVSANINASGGAAACTGQMRLLGAGKC